MQKNSLAKKAPLSDERFKKLVALLKELFQLDQPDLDFGIYRIMHAKSAEVTQFLERDLLPQVKEAFAAYQPADKAALQKELEQAIEQAKSLGVDPESTQKVKELRARLERESVDLDALEADVYDHLYRFFRRYYHEGDFISRRVYKEGVYAIPYEGEEVKLYWANHDQYYIKTAEYLRDYAFRLRPEDANSPMRVHFRLVDAKEGEHGNIKESNKRVFVLAAEDFIGLEDGPKGKELVIRFEYRPATLTDWPEAEREGKKNPPKQKDLLELAEQRILSVDDPTLSEWIQALKQPHIKASGEQADYSRLMAHLKRYTARNTFDYFIHKDLGGFLRRELDFYIKNEVMRLDDIENGTAPRVEQYLSKIKVIRKIAHKIIDFLAQLEDFQKKLWEKKKFVTETFYCITVGNIPEAFYPEVAENESQWDEWRQLFHIDENKSDLFTVGKSEKDRRIAFLKAHPTLVLDTRHFGRDFVDRLLASFDDLDDMTDGLLVHSENWQALNLMLEKCRERVKSIYIDPPYNTGKDEFLYKDNYQHSSWLSMMFDRLARGHGLLSTDGSIFVSIDDGELVNLKNVLSQVHGMEAFGAIVSWKRKKESANDGKGFSKKGEFLVCFLARPGQEIDPLPLSEEYIAGSYRKPTSEFPHGLWRPVPITVTKGHQSRGYEYPVTTPKGTTITREWLYPEESFKKLVAEGRIYWGESQDGVPQRVIYAHESKGVPPDNVWHDLATNKEGKKALVELFGSAPYDTPKPPKLIEHILKIQQGRAEAGNLISVDYFAGSGTTGHAVINLNREDGGRRKFILVEMGDYFDTVLLPRIKKVTFSPEWKNGKPKRMATDEEAERSPRVVKVIRLESYEDTLNNLELKRPKELYDLFSQPEVQGPDGFREQYILRYMLDVETRGSASLLNIRSFMDPTQYRLKVKRPGSDESREVCVDLIETFNWLIGLNVRHMSAPRHFTASFKRDEDPDLADDAPRRLLLDGRLKEDPQGRWWFRTAEGETRDGRRVLVIWRNRPGGEEPEGVEQDNLVLDEWFRKQGYSSKDSEFDLIYVNGTNNLENLKAPDDTWKVRLIEEDFHRLMFAMGDV